MYLVSSGVLFNPNLTTHAFDELKIESVQIQQWIARREMEMRHHNTFNDIKILSHLSQF
jgi:hypothetical protein